MKTLAKPNPFADILGAAASLPAESKALTSVRARVEHSGSGQVIIADVSGSMDQPSSNARSRFEVLRDAINGTDCRRIIAFSSSAQLVTSPRELPAPAGGTALHLALDMAKTLNPSRTLIVSDGEPDNEASAIAAAGRVPGVIDVVFCGPESAHAAKAFLMRLARLGAGRFAACDLGTSAPRLAPIVRKLLSSGDER